MSRIPPDLIVPNFWSFIFWWLKLRLCFIRAHFPSLLCDQRHLFLASLCISTRIGELTCKHCINIIRVPYLGHHGFWMSQLGDPKLGPPTLSSWKSSKIQLKLWMRCPSTILILYIMLSFSDLRVNKIVWPRLLLLGGKLDPDHRWINIFRFFASLLVLKGLNCFFLHSMARIFVTWKTCLTTLPHFPCQKIPSCFVYWSYREYK